MDAGGPLSDVSVRKAIDLAIDRNALVTALDGGKATRSLFPVTNAARKGVAGWALRVSHWRCVFLGLLAFLPGGQRLPGRRCYRGWSTAGHGRVGPGLDDQQAHEEWG